MKNRRKFLIIMMIIIVAIVVVGLLVWKNVFTENKSVYSFSDDVVSTGTRLDLISEYATNYETLNRNVFLKHNINKIDFVASNEVCFLLDGVSHCLKGGSKKYYEENRKLLFTVFETDNCRLLLDSAICSLSDLIVSVTDDGSVSVFNSDIGNFGSVIDLSCEIESNGDSDCIWMNNFRDNH